MTNDTSPCCPECGGTRPTWRIKRNRAGAARDSHRELLWTCAACGHAWSEPLSIQFEAVTDLEPAG